MKKIVLASTSTLYGESYLAYLRETIVDLFQHSKEIIFIPYARPGGISHEAYTQNVASFFKELNIGVKGLHEFAAPTHALQQAKGIFTGGGNTFLLVKALHELGLMAGLKSIVEQGTPYLGTSAGSNIGGVNMQTTNDMPIVYPPSFETMGLVPFNINAHYLDPDPTLKHNGETRETRIREFHVFNTIPVVGLREGSWIAVHDEVVTTEGSRSSRIFKPNQEPIEIAPGTQIQF
ncbi:dipeptidase PepE [Olivibacter ginsenosidimutans]|uniref:Dipeptidase PepE n=1 Tax=Olivibacter ginsenosidimutans TaxID=1176537 RepID=A0ABP9CGS0_9SPHI